MIKKYMELYNKVDQNKIVNFGKQSDDFYNLADFTKSLNNSEKIEIREILEKKNKNAPRDLYYNYEKQEWI